MFTIAPLYMSVFHFSVVLTAVCAFCSKRVKMSLLGVAENTSGYSRGLSARYTVGALAGEVSLLVATKRSKA